VKELHHLDLHRCLEAHDMDARPHVWGTIDDERCTWKMKDIAFGGTLASPKDEIVPSPTLMFVFEGIDVNLLALDVT
jgi:hypothetical protein